MFKREGNIGSIAESGKNIFGGPCFVAAGRFGSGLWTDIGLVPRIDMSPGMFSQGQGNEVAQELGDTTFQASGGGSDNMVSMNLLRFQTEQMATLFPSVVNIVEPGSTTEGGSATGKGGIGWNVNPGFVESVGLHIRPASAYGKNPGELNCVWIPQVRAKTFGTYTHKTEPGDATEEVFTVEFAIQRLARTDFTPGTPQTVGKSARMFYRGDPASVVPVSWEDYLPFGHILNAPGRPTTIVVTGGSSKFSVDVTAPASEFLWTSGGDVVYKYKYRKDDGTNGAFTAGQNPISPGTAQEVTSLTTGDRYEIRAWGETGSGASVRRGQQAVAFVTVA